MFSTFVWSYVSNRENCSNDRPLNFGYISKRKKYKYTEINIQVRFSWFENIRS